MTGRMRMILAAVLCGVALGAIGCSKLGPQKRDAEPPPVEQKGVYVVDLTKPEGPMNQILKAAQERDLALFKASFAPSVDVSLMDEPAFRKLRKKVLTSKLTPVPESVQNISDTEAIVKLRNHRGREIPVHVQKIDGKWLITSFDLGAKAKGRFKDADKVGGGAAQGQPPAPK